MSVETDTRLTEVAAAYRAAKFEFDHSSTLHREAVRDLRTADHSLALAEADLMAAEELLESRAADPSASPEGIQEAAQLLKAARVRAGQQKNIHLRLTAAVADRDQERLQARHSAALARKALYEEATHA